MKTVRKENRKGIPWTAALIVLLAVVAVIMAAVAQGQSNQAEEAIIPEVVFEGVYRVDGGDWQPLSDAGHISSTRGNVELKGIFMLYYGETGESLGAADRGTVISLYLDHLKAVIKDESGNVWESDNENALIGKGTCAETWTQYVYDGEAGEEVSITLYNPHVFGNEQAIDRFLEGISIYREGSNGILASIDPITLAVGTLLTVFLLILMGAGIFASLLHHTHSREVWLLGLLVFFGGVYFVFSRDEISIWNPANAANTLLLGSSMMLYLLTAAAIMTAFLDGALRRIATWATVLLGVGSLAAMLSSLHTSVKFYNTYPYWMALAVGVSLTLAVLMTVSMAKGRADKEKLLVYIPALTLLAAYVTDVVATLFGVWQGGLLSVLSLLAIVVTAAVVIGRVVPTSIKAILAAKSIEAEKQAMEMRLQESHISIMLSQIQPHFLYNTLNSIYHLCETNPLLARSLVSSFSEYLRNNLSSIEEHGLIAFETELSHIKTYLDIEKVRFEDTLEIEYDIRCVDFSLPVLTVQPIVENAVKHGTSKKRGGGRVIISTAEDREDYVITVTDTGCGFDPTRPKDDGKHHVGIENVRQRLANMCGGSLTIESEIGVGTVATIRIPKGGNV